jgi:hypothetical protein
MNDSSPQASVDLPTRTQLCDQVDRAVGSLWQRRFGARPASISTEWVGDVVRCTIEEGEAPAETEDAAPQDRLEARPYEDEAQAAVRRVTGRSVIGFVSKSAKNDSSVTQAFILAKPHVKH